MPQPTTADVLAAVEHANGATATGLERLRGAIVNETLTTETVIVPASGLVSRSFANGYGSVTVANPSAGAVTVSSSDAGDPSTPPASGVGTFKVAPGRFATLPMHGRSVSLYAAAGAVLILSVSTRPLPPAFGVCA
jgi:hypothetical protein